MTTEHKLPIMKLQYAERIYFNWHKGNRDPQKASFCACTNHGDSHCLLPLSRGEPIVVVIFAFTVVNKAKWRRAERWRLECWFRHLPSLIAERDEYEKELWAKLKMGPMLQIERKPKEIIGKKARIPSNKKSGGQYKGKHLLIPVTPEIKVARNKLSTRRALIRHRLSVETPTLTTLERLERDTRFQVELELINQRIAILDS